MELQKSAVRCKPENSLVKLETFLMSFILQCLSLTGSTVLANFRSNLGHEPRRPKVSELEVTPAGQEFFDHILLSLFVIERKRLTPEKKPSIFN